MSPTASPSRRGGSGDRVRVSPVWMVWFTLAWLAIWTVQLTPIQLLLPLQLDTQSGHWIDGVVWSGLLLSGSAHGPVLVGAAWVVTSVGVSVTSAALTALIADQLDDQRGAASAAASSAQAVGIVVGVGAIVLLGLSTGASYAVLAGF